MAIIDENSLNKDENQIKEDTQAPVQSGVAAFSGTGQSPNSKQGSGRFTNLQKYISANQGAGEQMASKLSNATNRDISAFNDDYGAKSKEIGDGVNAAKDLFNGQGEAFKGQLNNYQTGLNSFQNMSNRGNFDTTGQEVKQFTSSPQFADFQKLQSGLGLNESALRQSQGLAQQMGNSTLDKINTKNNQIQTQTGRYDLLAQSSPQYGNKATMGGNRLNQTLFQTNPAAVNQLQQSFQTQANDVAQKNAHIGQLGNDLTGVVDQEKALQDSLNLGAKGVQDSFYGKLNQQSNFDEVNNARQGLFNDYIEQMKTGQYSKDLADMLGLQGISTFNPATPDAQQFAQGIATGGISQKLGSFNPDASQVAANGEFNPNIESPLALPNQNAINPNQFRMYNVDTSNSAATPNNYLAQGRDAQDFQDLLLQPDYDAFQALTKLVKNDEFANRASGTTQLDPAVTKSKVNDYAANIKAADKNFIDNDINRIYDTFSSASRSYSSGPLNNSSGEDRNNIAPIDGDGKAPIDWQNEVVPHDGTTYGAYASGNLNDYLYNQNIPPSVTGRWVDPSGNREAQESAREQAVSQSTARVIDQLRNATANSGVRNVATIDNDKNLIENKYKKFKGLL